MKLTHTVTLRLSLVAAFVLALWSVFFYLAVMEEVRDETDDSLEDYSELVIIRYLSGEPLPTQSSGSNNQYFLRPVSAEYAASHPTLTYEDRSVYISEKREEEPARVLTTLFTDRHGRYLQLEVSTPSIDKGDLRRSMVGWLLFLYLTLIAAVVLCNYLVTRRALQPLYRLLRWLEHYRIGNSTPPPANPTTVSEFALLNDVVTDALQRSETLFKQQKEFVGNASHEMQTPLAVASARLEMLLEGETLTEEQAREVYHTLLTLRRLSQMNRALLLLSRIEGGQFVEAEPIDLVQKLRQILPDFEAAYAHKRISVRIENHDSSVWHLHPALADTLLQCLVKNAFAHNEEGGEIRISLTDRRLVIANTGAAEPLDAEEIFLRFHHSPDKKDSTGLGLSIAQAICRNYNFSLRYEHTDSLHTFIVEKS